MTLSAIPHSCPSAYIGTTNCHVMQMSHLEELKQHVEEMRRHVHGLDGLSGGLCWQTGTLGVNDTGQHQDHRTKTATGGCVVCHITERKCSHLERKG